MSQPRKIRQAIAGAAVIAAAAVSLSACAGGGSSYYSLCVNPLTQIRMPEVYCLLGSPYYHPGWAYYVPYGYRAPAINQVVTHYNVHNYNTPAASKIRPTTAPTQGGKVSKPASPSQPKVNLTKKPTTNTVVKPKSKSGFGSGSGGSKFGGGSKSGSKK